MTDRVMDKVYDTSLSAVFSQGVIEVGNSSVYWMLLKLNSADQRNGSMDK